MKYVAALLTLTLFLNSCSNDGDISIEEAYSYKYFKSSEMTISSTFTPDVNAVVEDDSQKLWVGTSNSICKINNDKIRIVQDNLYTSSVLLDNSGLVWFGTNDGPLVFDQNEVASQSPVFVSNPNISITSIIQVANGDIWLGTTCCGVIVLTDINTNLYTQYFDGLCTNCNYVNSLYLDADGVIWAGTKEGLWKFTGSAFTAEPDIPASLSVTAITRDAWGTLWIGTDKGIYKGDKGSYVIPKTPLYNVYMTSFCEDYDRDLYMGSFISGLWKYNGLVFEEILLENPSYSASFGWEYIQTIYKDKNGFKWIGTSEGLVRIR
ncbi:MAG: hypothetical protein OEW75_01910 [Cyclobacteriaceae bacterium]|nr:hypothetical protein [Cyclobacteriaceae bacterium]